MVHDGDLWRAYKRTRVHNQGRKKFGKTKRQGELYDSKANEEEELPQGAKLLHSGRTCVALRRRVRRTELGEFLLGRFWLSLEMQVCGGMCEAEPKSVKSVETKRQSLEK
jgi:hypothetical protein